ncbi:hypothetical protein [Collimonas fungivorans]|uniref:hypothetical protein n=1 Tax=Collimonas fungivorans TaxID=158899 RepID=UPI003FA399CD
MRAPKAVPVMRCRVEICEYLPFFCRLVLAGLRESAGNCRFDKARPRPAYFLNARPIVICGPGGIRRVLSFSAILAFYDICMSLIMAAIMQPAAAWPELTNLKKRMLN